MPPPNRHEPNPADRGEATKSAQTILRQEIQGGVEQLARPARGLALSAVSAGVSWLVTAARDTVAQVAIIVLVAGSIAFLGLHHSIAGSVEVLMGVFGGETSLAAYAHFLVFATIGNAIGGTMLVAGLKFSHVTDPGPDPE